MIIKYKLNDLGKDLGVTNKYLIELLAKYFEEPKRAQTTLKEAELDIIFETITKENQVKSFDEYFAMANEKEEPKEETADEKKPEEIEIKEEETNEINQETKEVSQENKEISQENINTQNINTQNINTQNINKQKGGKNDKRYA